MGKKKRVENSVFGRLVIFFYPRNIRVAKKVK